MPLEKVILDRLKTNDPTLQQLELHRKHLTFEDLKALVAALEHNTCLTALDLSDNLINDEGAQLLAQSLRVLSLNVSANKISDTGAAALAQNTVLNALDLSYNQVGDLGAVALAENSVLTSLTLRDNQVRSPGAAVFAQNSTLRSLILTDNFFDYQGAIILSQNRSLSSLELTGNTIGDEGAIALADNHTLLNLTLCHCLIGVVGAKALAANTNLKQLNLNYNKVSIGGSLDLAQNTSLTKLELAGNQIDNDGCMALAQNTTLASLNLSYNQINDKGIAPFTANTTLVELNLSHNQLSYDGIKRLSCNKSLFSLNLNYNLMINDKGAIALAQHETLTSLNLSGNRISSRGVVALAKNKKLLRLMLSHNLITDDGAVELAKNETLTELRLSYNEISDAGAKALASMPNLQSLNLDYNRISLGLSTELLSQTKIFLSIFLTEQSAEAAAETIRNIFLVVQDYFCVIKLNGFIELANPAFLRILNYSDEELLAKSFIDLLHYDDRQFGENLLRSINEAAMKFPSNFEAHCLCKDGSYRLIRWSFDVGENCIYAAGSDITENIRYRKALTRVREQAEQDRLAQLKNYIEQQMAFIAQVCHEIRNPLSSIYGYVDLISKNMAELKELIDNPKNIIDPTLKNTIEEQYQENAAFFKNINVCLEHQKNILDDNIDLTAIETKQLISNEIAFDLKALLEEVAIITQAAAFRKGLEFKIIIPDTQLMVKGDPGKLKKIIINLLNNAVKFTNLGSVILELLIVKETTDSLECIIKVNDTGIGLTDEEQNKLFQRFTQLSGSQYGGSGLGLYISKRFAQLMGGELTVKSEKGQFTTFSLNISFKKALEQQLMQEKETETINIISSSTGSTPFFQQVKSKILIVEDNRMNRDILKRILISQYECLLAEDGLKAVEIYDQEPSISAILMDMHMPKMDGFQATLEIRKLEDTKGLPRVPIIAVSAFAQKEDVIRAQAAGVNAYITKPYRKEEIYNMLKSHLEVAQPGMAPSIY